MDEDRWRRAGAYLAQLLESDAEGRAKLLDAADPLLRTDVQSLLDAHERTGPLDRLSAFMDGLRWDALAGEARARSDPDTAPAEPRLLLSAGSRVGRHEVRNRLGAGGMGQVYRAFDTRLRREVAVKVLDGRLLQEPAARRRFEEEARAASALNHPNIITVHDVGEDEGRPYIVMELVDGQGLRAVLGTPWPAEPLLHLAVQLADGLVAAHEGGIVHADLKPENLLVSRQGIVKILDFGLARFRAPDDGSETAEPRAGSGGPAGTLGYLSPEVIQGGVGDARSDQFAVGAILYEAATGTRAFAGGTVTDVLARTLRADPPALPDLRPDLPAAFTEPVMRCLRKDPDERYRTTRELRDALRAARRAAAAGGRPSGRRRPAWPAQRTRLIGRELDLAEIEQLIAGGEVRLLTLTGPGGTGKTRLALRAAEALTKHFPGGVFFVPLGAITDAALVGPAIASAVGAATPARDGLSGAIAELRGAGAPTLLLLDNFEHVMAGATLASELLAACPDLTLLVTSREMLQIYGEHRYAVPPLERPDVDRLPPPDELARNPAVALFLERARAVHPSFSLTDDNAAAVAAVCSGLDGLPLALELAAAQVRVLSPESLRARLDDRLRLLIGGARDLPGRQQTLRRTLDWSHQLLDETERAVLRRLSTFAGSFSLEAAQAVADPYSRMGAAIEDGVRALVNKSLLQAGDTAEGEAQFHLLETIREYAREKLAESGEAEHARRAHAAYFLVLAEEGASGAPDEPGWTKRLERLHDDFRAALEWLTRAGEAEWGLRMGIGLFPFWERAEHPVEGRRRLEGVLAIERSHDFPVLRARALFAGAILAARQGDARGGGAMHEESMRIYERLGDRRGIVVCQMALGNHYVNQGDFAKARAALEGSLGLWDELGDLVGYARALSNLAFVARGQRRFEEARRLYREAAERFARLGDEMSRAWSVNHEGDVARDQGELDAAEALYREALSTFEALGHDWGVASSRADLALVARQRGEPATAGRLYREALVTFVGLDHRRGIARMLESLACLAAEQDQAARAFRLAAAASALRERVDAAPSSAEHADLERSLAALRPALAAEQTRRAWQDGRAMSTDEAVRLALGDD